MKRLLGILLALAAFPAAAQSNPTYVPLGPAMGALYRPDAGAPPRVGVVVMHRTANYLSHPACTELSARGFAVLCMNSRFVNNEVSVNWDRIALDVRAGVEHLRRLPGIARVVLFGHSGGGPTMSFYQAVAENGVAYCQDPARIMPCEGDLAGLPRADGIVFVDAHPGQPVMVMRAMIPAVADESSPPGPLQPDLDPTLPANGYIAGGPSRYAPDFVRRYFEGQAQRMGRVTEDALTRWARIRAGTYPYPDNDLIVLPRAGNPGAGPAGSIYISQFDPRIESVNATRAPQRLLRDDGTVVRETIRSVIVPDPSIPPTALSFDVGTKLLSLRAFLSANAVRATDSTADGVDHCSSNNSTICAVRSIAAPVLFVAAGGFVFIRDNERMFEDARSADKELIYVEGANHGMAGCTPCETRPGQYANARRNFFDHVRDWINARF